MEEIQDCAEDCVYKARPAPAGTASASCSAGIVTIKVGVQAACRRSCTWTSWGSGDSGRRS